MADNTNSSFSFGQTVATVANIKDEIHELKVDLKEIKKMIYDLTYWKYRITGIAAGASAAVSVVIGAISHFIK